MFIYNMNREETLFAAFGGILMGLSISLFLIFYGKFFKVKQRILTQKWNQQFAIMASAFSGIVFCSAFYMQLYQNHYIKLWPYQSRKYTSLAPPLLLMISGFLHGVGASMANGGIYSHIFSGIPRFNLNSIIASLLIVGTAYFTRMNDGTGWISSMKINTFFNDIEIPSNLEQNVFIIIAMCVPFLNFLFFKNKSIQNLFKLLVAFFIGIIGSLGMLISGEANRKNVIQLLTYDKNWNPRLLVSLATALALNFIAFMVMMKGGLRPIFSTKIESPNSKVSLRTMIGSIFLGLSWGLTGMSIGPVFLVLPLKKPTLAVFWGMACLFGLILVSLLSGLFTKKSKSEKTN